ncbi:MAG: hypothetical protein HOQ44_11335, partial [Nocardia sp.]|nr:hypothetical protein [Nocardia sp.]
EGHVEGRVEEVVEKTLRLLEARGITVPDQSRERIRNCTDLAVLDRWFDRALTATEMNEIYAD